MEVNGLSNMRTTNDTIQKPNCAKLHADIGEFDPWTAWAYKPRTISMLLIGACLLM